MKTLLLRLAVLCAMLGVRALAAEPSVTFTVDPEEDGHVIYAPMGALSATDPPTGRLWFKVKITNSGPSALTLTSIRVQLTGIDVSIPQDNVNCPAKATISVALKASEDPDVDEVITVPHPAPPIVTFQLYFAGNFTPKTIQRILVPYVPATSDGQYLFPADEGDIGPDAYFSAGNYHPAGGSQGWGTDWSVSRVTAPGSTSTVRVGGDPDTNEGRLGWGVPIRAMADGIVLRTSTGWINNPKPGERAFQLMSEFDGEAISDVKVTRLDTTRAASLQRLPSGQVQLSIWETADVGRQITRLGSSALVPGETVTEMAIAALTGTRVVGIVRLSGNNYQRVIVWDILDDGLTVTQTWATNSSAVREVSLMKMTTTRFATGVRSEAGDLEVSVWEVDDTGLHARASGSGGVATSVCTTALSGTRFASSLRADSGALKVIVWDYVDALTPLQRRGEATAENISRVAATWNDGGKWITAMRTSPGGVLKLARWLASRDGKTLTPELVTTTTNVIQNTALAIAPGTGQKGTVHATTASVLAGGIFKINGWGNDPKAPNSYEYSAQHTAGTVTHVSLDQLGDVEYFVGVRTSGGALKIMTWHWGSGGGNNVAVLQGNCRVWYYHFQDGSVDTSVLYPGAVIGAGQVLGRMGNSGSSSGPHTHIHSERIHPDVIALGAQEVLARQVAGTLEDDIIGTRPVPFSGARAMDLSLIAPGGEGNPANSFATMNGQGMYDVPLGIRPRINTRYLDRLATGQNPTGRKEVVPGRSATGGPFRTTVAQAVGASPSGSRLYLRGGSYNEAITLNKRMTLRRYDYYEDAGSVVINP